MTSKQAEAPTDPVPRDAEGQPDDGRDPPEQPSGTDLVVRDATDRQEVVSVVDRHDEALIVEELQRRSLKVMLYSFPMDGSDVTDLSYLGVNEAVRVMNDSGKWQVTIDPDRLACESVTEDLGDGPEPCWQATVYAVNQMTGYGQFGTYTQPKRIKLKDAASVKRQQNKGRHVDDDKRMADKFARQKAVNKAQRNALRVHIPETMRQTVIAQYQGDPERIRRIEVGAGAEQLAKLPPPLTDERSDQQREQARAVFDEIRDVNPLWIAPAVFHAYLARAEHDHDRLDEFIAYLRDKLDGAKADAEKRKEAS